MKRFTNATSVGFLGVLVAATIALLLFCCSSNAASSSASSMSIEEFVKLPAFEGRIAKLEEIGMQHPRSISGPDFRISVTKDDGSQIVIERMPTIIGAADRLRAVAKLKKCELPGAIDLCWDDNSQWGETVDGLRLGIRLEPMYRHEFHPGELFSVVVKYQFQPADELRKLPLSGIENATEIHLETPEGREFIWDPFHKYKDGASAVRAVPADEWTDWQGQPIWRSTIRLANSKQQWVDAKTKQPAELSLGKEESFYRLWATCHVVAGKNAPRNAWHGEVRSGEVIFPKVTDLPIAKRNIKLTASQSSLVDRWLARPKADSSKPATANSLETSLRDALSLTENEALAQRLVEIAKTDPNNSGDALRLLSERTGDLQDGQAGIDGPYLKPLANYVVKKNEQRLAQPAAADTVKGLLKLNPVILYLGWHPDDQEIRPGMVKVLSQICRSQSNHSMFTSGPYTSWIPFSWAALLKLGELKPEMTREQAVELLGSPAPRADQRQARGGGYGAGGFGGGGGANQSNPPAVQENPDKLEWCCGLKPGAENPMGVTLEAQLKDGKTTSWKIHWPGEFYGSTPFGMPGD